jgi:hypothetical protein
MFFDSCISNGKNTKNIVIKFDFPSFFYFYFFSLIFWYIRCSMPPAHGDMTFYRSAPHYASLRAGLLKYRAFGTYWFKLVKISTIQTIL